MNVLSPDHITDAELEQRLRNGDADAMAEVYNRYYERVYRYAFSLIKMTTVTEDIVQEVFFKFWEKREQLQLKGPIRNYIMMMTHHEVVNVTRQVAKDKKIRDGMLYQYQLHLEENGPSPEELERMDKLLEEAMQTLTPQRKKVYELCKRKGLSYQQAADELGITSNTVKEHMSATFATLRRYVKEKGDLSIILLFFTLYK